MRFLVSSCFLFGFFFLASCKKETTQSIQKKTSFSSSVKYAKGFDIIVENGVKKLVVKKPYQDAEQPYEYILTRKTAIDKRELKVPVERMVVSSTSHIPMIELLNSENTLIGFPNTKFVSSEKTRALIDNGNIQEIGHEQNINTEKLIDISPDLVVGFALNGSDKVYSKIEKLGIPMIYNGDWLEETPLGRAEWIKFFGAILGKEKQADSIFNHIEQEYLRVKKLALVAKESPTVIAGSMYKNVWYVPAGESFKAQFFKDANLDYLWADTKGTGSLSLSFEAVLEKGIDANYWIGCGLFTDKQQMLSSNKNYSQFVSFQKSFIYNIASKKGATGGMIYFELSPVRPDLVLKDLIKITQPKLLKDYKLTFFDRLSL